MLASPHSPMRDSIRLPFKAFGCALICGFLPTACLIGPPDELVPPERVPPRAIVDQAAPSVLMPVQTLKEGPLYEFRVPFVSEDLGERVVGRLFLNYGSEPTERDLGSDALGPGTLAEVREMVVRWTKVKNLAAGCYSVTMTITHNDNYSPVTLAPIDLTRTAFVTWWIAHDVEPSRITLDQCSPPAFPPPQ
jgi:hypothetical protein